MSNYTQLRDRCQKDPEFFFREVLGDDTWEKQVAIAEAVRDNPDVSVYSCNSSGKSYVAARIVLWFVACHAPSIGITTAPTDRQVRKVLWKEIGIAHAQAERKLGGKVLTQRWEIDRDWYAWGFTAPQYDPNKFSGFHAPHVLVVADEADGISEDVHDGIAGVLASGHSRLLKIGNPIDPMSTFAKDQQDPNVKQISIAAWDTPNFTEFGITERDIQDGSWEEKVNGFPYPYPSLITPEWAARRAQRWGVGSGPYNSRIKGEYPTEGENQLIPYKQLHAALQRTLKVNPDAECVLGVDCARGGIDKSTGYLRRGSVLRRAFSLAKYDTMEVAGAVIRVFRAETPEVIRIDTVGIGAGVYDRLLEQGYPVEAINAGTEAWDTDRFWNLRAEMFWNLKELAEAGQLDIDNEMLVADLSAIRWKELSNGQIQIPKKAEIKKVLKRSPDDADAAAFTVTPGVVENLALERAARRGVSRL